MAFRDSTTTGLAASYQRAGVFGAKVKGFEDFGGGFKDFGAAPKIDLNDPDVLYQIAQLQGGAIAGTAEELFHPQRSILATVGKGFKNAFMGFLDVLMTPSEIMAGILSPELTIREAMKKDIMPSDVLFGEPDKDRTTMQKVGGFFVRTALDILLDPLTYVTFGAGQGIFGLRGATKLTLAETAATKAGIKSGFAKAVNKKGQELFKFLKGVENQALGRETIKSITKGKKLFGLAKDELDDVMRMTIDSPLKLDHAKMAMSNLINKNPELVKTLLDKGGIKFFGRTVLSGQRIGSAMQMIPGYNMMDHALKKVTRPIQALFDPRLIKVKNQYVKLPEEFLEIETAGRELAIALGDDRLKELGNIVHANKLNVSEAKLLTVAVEANKIPADKRLANVYMELKKFNKDEWNLIKKVGVPIAYIDNHFPHVLVENADMGAITFKSSLSVKSIAAKPAEIAKFVEAKPHVIAGRFNAKAIPDVAGKSNLVKTLDNVSTIEEAIIETGKFTDEIVERGRVAGKSVESILDSPEIEKIRKFRESIEALQEGAESLVGKVDQFGLKPIENQVGLYVDKGGKTWERVRATITDIKEMGFEGFDDNIITGLARRSVQNTRTYTMNNFVNSLTHHMGRSADEAPEGWRAISSSAVREKAKEITAKEADKLISSIMTEGGEEIFFHPAIAKRIEEFVGATMSDDAINDFFKGFDKLQNLWKASVTSIFPAFHGRNAISNVFLHFMDLGVESLNPRTHALAGDFIVKDVNANRLMKISKGVGEKADKAKNSLHDLLTTKVFTDGSGYNWTFGELRSVVRNKGVAFRSDILGQIDIRQTTEDVLKSMFKEETGFVKRMMRAGLPFTQDFFLFKGGKRAGRMIEEHARMTDFLANLRKTGDVTLAAQRTKQFLFDYGNLTNFEKQFMRRIIPFWTFTKKNLELQVKSLFRTPGRVAAQFHGLTNIGDMISGGNLTKEEKKNLPDWLQDGITFLLEKRGSTVDILGSLGTPTEQVFQAWQPNAILGAISPILKVPAELATGYNFFYGKPLQDVTNAAALRKAPTIIKNFVGYTKVTGTNKKTGEDFEWEVSLKPERMHLILNLPPTSRVFSALKQMQNQKISTQAKTLQFLIGMRPFEVDLQREADRKERELRDKLQKMLQDAGIVAKFERAFIPKE